MVIEIYSPDKITNLQDILFSAPCFKGGVFDQKDCYGEGKTKQCKKCYKYKVDINLIGEIK